MNIPTELDIRLPIICYLFNPVFISVDNRYISIDVTCATIIKIIH